MTIHIHMLERRKRPANVYISVYHWGVCLASGPMKIFHHTEPTHGLRSVGKHGELITRHIHRPTQNACVRAWSAHRTNESARP